MIKTKVGQLGLTIPVQHRSASATRITPKEVERWRNDLPLADTGISSKRLYDLLLEANQTPLPPAERFAVLELLRAPIQFICQSLKKHYLYQIVELSPKKITIARFSETLQLHMTYGYKTVLEDIADQGNRSDDAKRMAATTIQRTLHYFNDILLRCYELYSPALPGIWQEAHQLYLYADNEKLLKDPILAGAYERLALLAATDPYKWRQSDQEHINNVLDIWTQHTRLLKAGSKKLTPSADGREPNLVVIDPRVDQAPTLLARKDLDRVADHCLLLDVGKLVDHLKTVLAAVESNETTTRNLRHQGQEFALSVAVLKGLIRDWSVPSVRGKERQPRSQEVRVCSGLSATHYYVNGERLFQANPETNVNPNLVTSTTLTGSFPRFDVKVEEHKSSNELGLTEEEAIDLGNIPLPDEKIFIKMNDFKTTPCTLANDNENGYCLLWQGSSYPPIQAGDILGVQSRQSAKAAWQVGVVRWLKHTDDEKAKLGIELLGDTATAGGIQLMKDGQPSGQYLRCLLIDKNTIITPLLPFKISARVMIRTEADDNVTTIEADLVKLVESTGSHKQFEFVDKESRIKTIVSTHGEKDKNAADKKSNSDDGNGNGDGSGNGKKKDDPFDSLWTNL